MRSHRCEYPEDGRKAAVRSKESEIQSLQSQIEQLKQQVSERSPSTGIGEFLGNNRIFAPDRPVRFVSPNSSTSSVPAQLGDVRSSRTPSSRHPTNADFPLPQLHECPSLEGNTTVYGATSLLHDDASGHFWKSPTSSKNETDAFLKRVAQDRLIAQAATSYQREAVFYSTPSVLANADFDGVSADIAMQLLELHWNRLHYTYLWTYRPAIMDSILNNGPYVNKLLLNAIFLQSSPFTDLSIVRTCPEDPSTTGMGFYDRFKELLPQHIDNSTMPTVVALVVCGVCLVPYGKQSAGWVYCGMAYRMMVDLGYHLDIPSGIDSDSKIGVSVTEMEMRRRIYWGAYASDKFQSLYLGRPPGLLLKDGNISKELLDSYEEMEQWNPGSASISPTVSYKGRPAYAISCFQGMLQLATIAEEIIQHFYSVRSSHTPMPDLLRFRSQMRESLSQWMESLPTHLLFEPGKDDTPPPNLVSLQVSYWTLVILLEQAFLNRGHFDFSIELVARDDGRRRCIDAAFKIWRLLETYNTCFTLRHAHYGLLYAAYSAVLVILQHAHQDQERYISCIKFFWMILSEYQRKFGRGLRKPFKVLKSLMQQMKEASRQIGLDESSNSNDQQPTVDLTDSTYDFETLEVADTTGWPDVWQELMADNTSLMDDTMFGLFTK
ncbi:hypothetical protein CaCOL14_001471 [Colletotrichum acutatum]